MNGEQSEEGNLPMEPIFQLYNYLAYMEVYRKIIQCKYKNEHRNMIKNTITHIGINLPYWYVYSRTNSFNIKLGQMGKCLNTYETQKVYTFTCVIYVMKISTSCIDEQSAPTLSSSVQPTY